MRRWILLPPLLVLFSAVGTVGAVDGSGAEIGNVEDIEWPAYGGAPGGGHYTTASEITRENVDQLKLAWSHRSGDYAGGANSLSERVNLGTRPTAFVATPVMVAGTLYYCTPFNRVFALDPSTGKERWAFDPQVDMSDEPSSNCRGVSSWVDPQGIDDHCSHRIMLGTLDARLIAIDAKTGERCKSFGTNGEVSLLAGVSEHAPFEYSVTSAPAIIGDLVVTGALVFDNQRPNVPSGVVRAYNIRSGEFAWGWNPVHPDRPQREADGTFVSGTTNVWSTISVDAERSLVIVPTGNSSPDIYGGNRDGHLDYYSSSVVALNAADGTVAWHYQTVHHDIWDYDVASQPTFVDLNITGQDRPAVVQTTKMGLTFVLDRETGKPLHPVEERPVPQTGAVPGEYLSPTQPFPVKPDPLHQLGISPDDAWGLTFWDKGKCRNKLESITTGPIYTPPSLKGTALYPNSLGGPNWGAPAVDPNRKIMVANSKHLPVELKLIPRDQCPADVTYPQDGSPYCVTFTPLLSPFGIPCTPPPWATLAAVDLISGDILWQIPLGTTEELAPWPFYHLVSMSGITTGGPMVTASGLTFIASTSDAYLRAFDTMTGNELWKTKLPTSGNSVPMSYSHNGHQYIVVAAGGHFTFPLPSGDHLLAYRLP